VKIAHRGFEEQFKTETKLLRAIGDYPTLLRLIVHPNAPVSRPYRKYPLHSEIRYYAVYEQFEGEYLDHLLENRRHLPLPNAAWLIIQLADVVAKLHVDYGKVVLNLSPETILVRSDRQGISRPVLVDLTLASDIGATAPAYFRTNHEPIYTAPEALSGQIAVPATDVYGLGLVLYEVLTGQKAFPVQHRSDVELREAVVSAEPVPISRLRPDISPQIQAIVTDALRKDSRNRQNDIRTFAKQLRRIAGEVPVEARKFQFKHEMIAAVIVITVVLLVFVLVSLLLQSQ